MNAVKPWGAAQETRETPAQQMMRPPEFPKYRLPKAWEQAYTVSRKVAGLS
jgi:hypothetical protein